MDKYLHSIEAIKARNKVIKKQLKWLGFYYDHEEDREKYQTAFIDGWFKAVEYIEQQKGFKS